MHRMPKVNMRSKSQAMVKSAGGRRKKEEMSKTYARKRR